ncbi:MAG: HAD family hydrolase [Bacilli bacterium]|jgi:Cof subfamily protein (haloacid dehalogenase superfamily)|nr:HAD family hydrolase [Bacilli bacterium]
MNRKLIAVDVDGTLINDQLVLSKKSTDILLRVQEKGHIIVLASGRPWRSMKPFYEQLHLTSPIIAYNGAHVFDPKEASFQELRKRFKADDVKDIYLKMGPAATSFMCESEHMVYLKRNDSYLSHYFPYEKETSKVGDIIENLDEDTYTMIYRSSHQNVPCLKAIVEEHDGILFRPWSHSFYSEAYIKGVNKGSALIYVMKTLGISKEDVIAFGDSDNDDEMLSLAGLPFALKDCKSPMLLQKYRKTKATNNQDGVALTLADLLLN